MKLEAAIATISAAVGLSAFSVEAKTTILPEKTKLRTKVRDTISKLGPIGGTRKRALQKKLRERKLAVLNEANGPLSKDNEHVSSGLDLGILGAVKGKITQNSVVRNPEDFVPGDVEPDQRYLEEDYFQEYIDYLEGVINSPFAFNLDYYCEEVGSLCNSCGSIKAEDPITGEPTGSYDLALDCPLVEINATFLEPFENLCNGANFCEGCEPLCQSCSVDKSNFILDNRNCTLTKEVQAAMGLGELAEYLEEITAYLDALFDLYAALEEGSHSYGNSTEMPMPEDSGDMDEPVDVVIEEQPENEPEEEPEDEPEDEPAKIPAEPEPIDEEPTPEPSVENTAAAESGAHTPRSVILAAVVAGSSWLWMAT